MGFGSKQEEISQTFFNKLSSLAATEKIPTAPRHFAPTDHHQDAWQSMFNAANDAFTIFKNYEKLKQFRKESELKHDTTQEGKGNNQEYYGYQEAELPNLRKFVSFAAVPAVPRTAPFEIKDVDPIIEYIPYSEQLMTTPQPTKEASTAQSESTTKTLTTTTASTTTATSSTTTIISTSTSEQSDEEILIQDGPKLVDFIIRNVFELTKGADNDLGSDLSSATSVPLSSTASPTTLVSQSSYSTSTTTETTTHALPSTESTLMIDIDSASQIEDINDEVAQERQFNDISEPSVRHSFKYRDLHGLDFYFPDVLRVFFRY